MSALFKTIVVPTDFSDLSLLALRQALPLAEPDGRVVLCHVVDDVPLTWGYLGVGVPYEDLRSKASVGAEEKLDAMAEQYGRDRIDTRVCHGKPAKELVRLADAANADLVIMGTHGRGGLEHAILGSVAEEVMRKASCPVMVVRQTS